MEEQKEVLAQTQKEIKKEFTQQSEALQKRLADRRKRLAVKNSMNSSVCSDMMYSDGGMGGGGYMVPMSTTNSYFQTQKIKMGGVNRPSTSKRGDAPVGGFFGSSMRFQQLQAAGGNKDFPGDVSMIDRVGGNQGDEQFLDEQSFNQELLLMKLGNAGSPNTIGSRMKGIDNTVSTQAHTNSHHKKHMMHQNNIVIDSTFDYAEASNFE